MSLEITKNLTKKILGKRYRRYSGNFKASCSILKSLRIFFQSNVKNSKRVLIVYDFKTQPFSIGDLLLAQVAGLILCAEKYAQYVDVALLLDPDQPKSLDPAFNNINKENYLYNFAAIFPLLQFNNKLGSVLIFNKSDELAAFFQDKSRYLSIWPTALDVFFIKRYLHYTLFDDLLYPYWLKNKSMPELEPIGILGDWARTYINKVGSGRPVVTVNIRNNKNFQQERNLNIDVWIAFFKKCAINNNVLFILLCAKCEIDDRLRACTNVVFAKDDSTTVEQDLALISAADIHMGASSGPATIAWFSHNKPYFIVRFTLSPDDFESPSLLALSATGYYKFCFSENYQKFYAGEETLDILMTELDSMCSELGGRYASEKAISHNPKFASWLR